MPAVSVIIPAFNSQNTIGRAIDSVLAQEYHDVEIIVVDDGSTDCTASLCQGYGSPVRVITQEQSGAGAARNAGIAASTGEYVAFLDSDDEWLPGKLREQVTLLEGSPEVGIASAAAEYLSTKGRLLYRGHFSRSGDLLGTLLQWDPVVTSSVVVRRALLDQMGQGFRPDLRVVQDWELWIRLAARARALISGKVMVRYHVGTHSLTATSTPTALAAEYGRLFSGLRADPVAGPVVVANWTRVQANIHSLVAYRYYESGDAWQARAEILRAFCMCPTSLRWRSAIGIMLLPVRVGRALKALGSGLALRGGA